MDDGYRSLGIAFIVTSRKWVESWWSVISFDQLEGFDRWTAEVFLYSKFYRGSIKYHVDNRIRQ